MCFMSEQVDQYKQPSGLWVMCFATAMLTIGFGVINSLLVLYVTTILKLPSSQAYLVYGVYNSLLFTLPLLGGYFSEKLGYSKAFILGSLLNLIGLLILSEPHLAHFYWGLAFFAAGIGLNVPAFYVLLGKQYQKEDHRRDSGFTIAYVFMNFGFFVSAFIGAYLSRGVGYHLTYLISAIFALLIIVVFLGGYKLIKPVEGRDMAPGLQWHPALLWAGLIVIEVIVILLTHWFLTDIILDDTVLFVLLALVTIYVIYLALKFRGVGRHKLFAFLILAFISIGFWSLYTLEPSLLTIFIKTNVDRHLFGYEIPPSVFYGLDPFFVIVIGCIFGYLWTHLEKKNKNPSLPAKFTLSLFLMGIGFFIFIVGIYFSSASGLSNLFWIVFGYLFLSVAELLISPIGLAMVGRLAPEGNEGRLIGIWQLFTGVAGVIAGYLAQLAVTPPHDTAIKTNPVYMKAFFEIGMITIVLGVIMLFLTPFIRKLIAK